MLICLELSSLLLRINIAGHYLRRRLASGEGIVSLGVRLSRCVCVRRISLGGEGLASGEGIVSLGVRLSRCVCVRCISLGGEGNALYPVLSS